MTRQINEQARGARTDRRGVRGVRETTTTAMVALVACGAIAGGLPGCGPSPARQFRTHVSAGRYDQALVVLRERKHRDFKSQDRVAYWLDEGLLLHLAGHHQEAIQSLSLAERRTWELYTRSIRRDIHASFTSDEVTEFAAAPHEDMLINAIKAVSYLALDDREGALVEARRIREKLEYLRTRPDGGDGAYRDDAFARWLIGVLFELEGSYDDARIAYTGAMQAYGELFERYYGTRAPSWLAADIARVAARTGEGALAEQYRAAAGDAPQVAELGDRGEVIVLHLNGEQPGREERAIKCWVPPTGAMAGGAMGAGMDRASGALAGAGGIDGAAPAPGELGHRGEPVASADAHGGLQDPYGPGPHDQPAPPHGEPSGAPSGQPATTGEDVLGVRCDARPGGDYLEDVEVTPAPGSEQLSISLPALKVRNPARGALTVTIGGTSAQAEIALPIAQIAVHALRERLPAIYQRAVRRAITKATTHRTTDAAKGMVGGRAGSVLGFTADLFTGESADVRTWTLLPARIEVARLVVPAGTHEVTLAISGRGPRTRTVRVRPGQRVFVTVRTMP